MTAATAQATELYTLLASYIDLGIAVLPIWGFKNGVCACPDGENCPEKQRGKHPLTKLVPNGVKNATRDKKLLREWVKTCPTANWAIRTGEPLLSGGFLVILDVDPRNGGDASLAHFPDVDATPTVDTGGGGTHYWLRVPSAVSGKGIGPGLDLQASNKYALIPPSAHASGGTYTWRFGLSPDLVGIVEAPDWVLEATEASKNRPAKEGEGTARDTVLGEAFALTERLGPVMPDGTMWVACPWADEHSDGRGHGEDSSTVILPPAGGSLFGGFRCQHGHCANRKWSDVLAKFPAPVADAARKKFPLRLRAVDVAEDTAAPPPPPPPRDPYGGIPLLDQKTHDYVASLFHCKRDADGNPKILPDTLNATTVFNHDPRWKGVMAFDEFERTVRFRKTPPWHVEDRPKEQKDTWEDLDAQRMNHWIKRTWNFDINPDRLAQTAFMSAETTSTHPVREYLNSLVWDGSKRLDTWTWKYLGAEETHYHSNVGKMWMLSAVARIYEPGCKADHVLILEGDQGIGKSTALSILAGKWFNDTPLDFGSKDAYGSLRGKWIVELAELASFGRSEVERIKAFFSSAKDSYRPPYGKSMVTVPRQCVFAGTVNPEQYLEDSTGNRRFWPVKCNTIDTTALRYDRDQLWAETVARYKAGETWHPKWEDVRDLQAEQAKREIDDPWAQSICEFLNSDTAGKMGEMITVKDIAHYALSIRDSDLNRGVEARIGKVMARLPTWKKKRKVVSGMRLTGYGR